jgi:hypothetical protein
LTAATPRLVGLALLAAVLGACAHFTPITPLPPESVHPYN